MTEKVKEGYLKSIFAKVEVAKIGSVLGQIMAMNILGMTASALDFEVISGRLTKEEADEIRGQINFSIDEIDKLPIQ